MLDCEGTWIWMTGRKFALTEEKDDVLWSGNGKENSIRKNWKEKPILLSVTPVSFSSTEEVRDSSRFSVWFSKVKSFSWGSTWYLKRGYSLKNKLIQESWISFVTKKVRLHGHATLSSGLRICLLHCLFFIALSPSCGTGVLVSMSFSLLHCLKYSSYLATEIGNG